MERALIFEEPFRQAAYDVICRSDHNLLLGAACTLKEAHDEAARIFFSQTMSRFDCP